MATVKEAGVISAGSTQFLNWKDALSLYRELMSDEPLIPSGADLVAQWQGGVIHFKPLSSTCDDIFNPFDWSSLLVFSATHLQGRKVPTHEHLEILSKQGFPAQKGPFLKALSHITEQGAAAIRGGSAPELGKAFDDYADMLSKAGLEVQGAHEDRQALRQLPGVLGVKGTGALQSDALLVVLDSKRATRELVLDELTGPGLGFSLQWNEEACKVGPTVQSLI